MPESTLVILISAAIVVAIAAFCVWVVIKDRRRFKKRHPELVGVWRQVADGLGLAWVVPVDHVLETKAPPALHGKLQARQVYLALQDESDEESLRQKWELVVHVELCSAPRSRKMKRSVLKALRRNGATEARVKQKTLIAHRPGLRCSPDAISAFVSGVLEGATELDET